MSSQMPQRSGVLPEEIAFVVFDQIEKHFFSVLVETIGERNVDAAAVFGTDDESPFALVLVIESLPNEGCLLRLILGVDFLGVADDVEEIVGHGVGSRFGPMNYMQAFI